MYTHSDALTTLFGFLENLNGTDQVRDESSKTSAKKQSHGLIQPGRVHPCASLFDDPGVCRRRFGAVCLGRNFQAAG